MSVSSVSTPSSDLLQQLQSRIDRGGSGGVTRTEAQGATTAPLRGEASPRDVAAPSRSAGPERDDRLSRSEVRSAFESLSSDMRSQLLGLQERTSPTGNAAAGGAVAGDATADSNDDGTVTPNEQEAYNAARPAAATDTAAVTATDGSGPDAAGPSESGSGETDTSATPASAVATATASETAATTDAAADETRDESTAPSRTSA